MATAVGDGTFNFQNFPCEIKDQVFLHLSPQELCKSVIPVCREWRWIANSNRRYWKTLHLVCSSSPSHKQWNSYTHFISTHSSHLEELSVSMRETRSSYFQWSIGEVFETFCLTRKLKSLTVKCFDLDDLLQDISIKIPDIQHVKFKRCSAWIDDDVYRELSNLVNVKSLYWDVYDFNWDLIGENLGEMQPYYVQNQFVDCLTDNFPNLEKVTFNSDLCLDESVVRRFYTLKRHTLQYVRWTSSIVRESTLTLLSQCSNLRHLKIDQADFITDDILHALSRLNLVYLCLDIDPYQEPETYVSEDALILFFSDSPARIHLKNLDIPALYNVSIKVLKEMFKNCLNLTRLCLSVHQMDERRIRKIKRLSNCHVSDCCWFRRIIWFEGLRLK